MMKDTLKAVLTPFGPAGAEGPIAEVIRGMIEPHVDEISTDALGNLIAIKHGPKDSKRVMFSAHMDTIGYVAMDADKDGFIRVSNLGGVNPSSAAGRHVVFANGVGGVTYIEPLRGEAPTIRHLYIDVGASSREEALEKVPVGTMAAICHQFTDMGDRVSAPYMDNRVACAILIELLKALKSPKHEILAVFSSQEEVGLRGATVAAYALEPDIGVAVDVTGAGDTPACDPLPMKVGAGPAIKVKDSRSISTPLVRDGLVSAAKKAGVPYQYEVLPFGGTDAGAIMISRGGVPSGTVSISCRYVHAPVETVSISDMENAVTLLTAYVQQILD
ncbi:M42 family metallopeptidase [Eubacteriales bacterium OttesenSCG-928-A19]|nr:M42 family metallopeptidase [Eubacteriales bacterium OttesenSCG-928-A19]